MKKAAKPWERFVLKLTFTIVAIISVLLGSTGLWVCNQMAAL